MSRSDNQVSNLKIPDIVTDRYNPPISDIIGHIQLDLVITITFRLLKVSDVHRKQIKCYNRSDKLQIQHIKNRKLDYQAMRLLPRFLYRH